jgi:hypothetical protein
MVLWRPDSSDGELEHVSVRVAEINRRRIVSEALLTFDGHAAGAQMLAPGVHFLRGHAKSHVTGAARAVRDRLGLLGRLFRAKKQQDAFADSQGHAAPVFEFADQAQPEDVTLERHRALQVFHVERALQHPFQLRHRRRTSPES